MGLSCVPDGLSEGRCFCYAGSALDAVCGPGDRLREPWLCGCKAKGTAYAVWRGDALAGSMEWT